MIRRFWKSGLNRATKKINGTRGQGMIELIASLLMFTLLMTLIINVSTYLYIQHTVVTAAREGARVASLNEDIGDPSGVSQGIAEVKDHVIDLMTNTTGIQLDGDQIQVTPPNPADPLGDREVEVAVTVQLDSILPAAQFASAFSEEDVSSSSNTAFARAVMRYEE